MPRNGETLVGTELRDSQQWEHYKHFQDTWLEGEEREQRRVVGKGGQFQSGKDLPGKKKENMASEPEAQRIELGELAPFAFAATSSVVFGK